MFYIAPEVLRGERYDFAGDLFAVGTVTYTLLFGEIPFTGNTDNEKITSTLRCNVRYPEAAANAISSEAVELLELLLTRYPENRLTSSEALDNQWF